MMGRRFSTAKKKSRGRANGLTLPPTELLRNKANEMAALRGQMQYQVTATSTGMGMPTGPGPGPHSQYEIVGQQMQGGGTQHSSIHSTAPTSAVAAAAVSVPATTGGCDGSGHGSSTSNGLFCSDADAAYMQQVQVPVAAAMMPATASRPTMAAQSPFGYNPMGPGYGHYHQTMGGGGNGYVSRFTLIYQQPASSLCWTATTNLAHYQLDQLGTIWSDSLPKT